jgi:hypothetical protein
MDDKLQNKLFKNYPKIFKQVNDPITETCMCWGIDTENGWYWLINELCSSIQSYIDANQHLEIQQVEAVQVKQKYGSLRFYYSGGNDDINGMVMFAEKLSYSICENCGSKRGIKHTRGWILTLCSRCFSKYQSNKSGI